MQPKDSSISKPTQPMPDVAKPGESAPSATSKPVIVGHKIEVQDPTLVSQKQDKTADALMEDKADAAAETAPLNHAEKTIQPLNDMTKADLEPEIEASEPEESNDSMQAASAAESKAESEAANPKSEPSSDEKPQSEATGEASASEGSAVGAVAEQVGANKAQEKKAEEEAKRRKELEKLIESKQYFVNIGETKKQRSLKIFLVVSLVFIVGLELAIDAGLLGSDIKPLVDLI